jgi:hypothetical protein
MEKDPSGESSTNTHKSTGVELPAPFGCIVFLLMLLAVPISIPWGLIRNWHQQRKERAFTEDLRQRQRLMAWEEFLQVMEERRGTLIWEAYSLKGPFRYWWTPEDVRKLSPHPVGDWMRSGGDRSYVDFSYWCRERYTDRERGTAMLVDDSSATREESRVYFSQFMREEPNPQCVRVTPPEALPKELRKTQES